MSTTVRINAINVVEVDSENPLSRIPWASIPDEVESTNLIDRHYFIKYGNIPSQYLNKEVEETKVYLYEKHALYYYPTTGNEYAADAQPPYIVQLIETWDENTISYNVQPANYPWDAFSLNNNPDNYSWSYIYGKSNRYHGSYSDNAKYRNQLINTLTYGGRLTVPVGYVPSESPGGYITQNSKIRLKTSAYLPYIEITFGNSVSSLILESCSPTSGYLPKNRANTFVWSTALGNVFSINTPTISRAYFRYRANSSSQYTQINCGSASSYTMPANTISTNSFQWQVEITDSNGNVITSDWYTISTQEALSSATIVEPKNMTIDGAAANSFVWNHIISTGTAQTKADLQYSTNGGSSWTQFATPTGSSTNTVIPANTFSAGSYLWRVRTYNTDNSAGSWSDEKPFTVIAKPTVRAVTSEQNPKPKISWQSTGQQAYRVYIDNVFDSGALFGTNDSYTLPIYLDDGSYTVKVIVQNSYGLWSDEGSAPIIVNNVPGTAMTLTAINSNNGVLLNWTSVLSYAYYVVYRDGIAIAKIRENTYTDCIVLGEHSYFIRGIYASTKNYGSSNIATINAYVNELTITDLETLNTISIELNDSSYAEISITDAIKNTTIYISSSDYPINETSHFKSKIISFSCAFIKRSELETSFRNMLGNLVCIKTKHGTSVVGNLLEQHRTENEFYVKYNCSLNQTNYNEEIQL